MLMTCSLHKNNLYTIKFDLQHSRFFFVSLKHFGLSIGGATKLVTFITTSLFVSPVNRVIARQCKHAYNDSAASVIRLCVMLSL